MIATGGKRDQLPGRQRIHRRAAFRSSPDPWWLGNSPLLLILFALIGADHCPGRLLAAQPPATMRLRAPAP